MHSPENKAGTAFGRRATPNKFVVAPEGYIRFDEIGYAGSDDKEYYRLKAMVEIMKERSSCKTAQEKQ